jgi:cephalosporin-C deacetylase-like acetyl esterase
LIVTRDLPEFEYYPTETEVDAWLEEIWQQATETDCKAEPLSEHGFGHQVGVRHVKGYQYVRFSPHGMDPFYGYWQPAPSGPAPLLIHTPGYGAEMSVHPDLVMQGYNVLHVNPLGYSTPMGANEAKKQNDTWPVLSDTILSRGKEGYHDWLINCVLAIHWAQRQKSVLADRVSFFGTSQGGGGSMLLGSLYQNRGVRSVAADVPWMANFPLYSKLDVEWGKDIFSSIHAMQNPATGWYALGLIDALSHVRRLTIPVMLVAGGEDTTCPPATIESVFAELGSTRLFYDLDGQGHDYTQEFIAVASAWFRLYA